MQDVPRTLSSSKISDHLDCFLIKGLDMVQNGKQSRLYEVLQGKIVLIRPNLKELVLILCNTKFSRDLNFANLRIEQFAST